MKNRLSWDQIWTGFCKSIAQRSVDPKYKVGAVIVNKENTQVMSLGYNGDHKGGPNRRDSLDTGKSGFIHAEINALIKCNYNSSEYKKMYITHSPCCVCAKAIVNGNISEVIFIEKFHDTKGIDILKSSGIIVRQFSL